MSTLPIPRTYVALFAGIALALAAESPCMAKKGGNPGGQPGEGDPPPAPEVIYGVTRVPTSDYGYIYLDSEISGGVVGWTYLDDTSESRRGFAYVPDGPDAGSYYLDDPALGVASIPNGWHTRSAIGINSHGTVVGNLQKYGDPTANEIIPFVIPNLYDPSREMIIPSLLDPFADKESIMAINDHGDMVIQTKSAIDGAQPDKVFVGNLGLYDESPPAFIEIDFASHGISIPSVDDDNFSLLKLSNRSDPGPAVLAGEVADDDQNWVFRSAADGSSFEKLLVKGMLLEDSQEVHRVSPFGASDLRDNGDILLTVAATTKKGRGKTRYYPAIWKADDSSIVPVPGSESTGARHAYANNDGDFLLVGGSEGDYLWHGDWSIDNGPIAIENLIDPSDPDAALLSAGVIRELTDRDASGWPTLFSNGSDFVVLRPQETATLVVAAVPEPHTGVLAVIVLVMTLPRFRARVITDSSASHAGHGPR